MVVSLLYLIAFTRLKIANVVQAVVHWAQNRSYEDCIK
jgi:hypothetical protein